MKQKIENLKIKIGKLMQDHLVKRDFYAVTALSPLLSRAQGLETRHAEMETEVAELETKLTTIKSTPATHRVGGRVPVVDTANQLEEEEGRGTPHTLRIKVDWKANSRNRDPEDICEHTAAASMAAFVSRLIQEFGDDAIQKLSRLRVNRGLLISKTPAKDFLNQAQGKLYGHKKLRGTEYYILTHSATSQKVKDLNRVCRVIGLLPTTVEIEEVDRLYMYANL